MLLSLATVRQDTSSPGLVVNSWRGELPERYLLSQHNSFFFLQFVGRGVLSITCTCSDGRARVKVQMQLVMVATSTVRYAIDKSCSVNLIASLHCYNIHIVHNITPSPVYAYCNQQPIANSCIGQYYTIVLCTLLKLLHSNIGSGDISTLTQQCTIVDLFQHYMYTGIFFIKLAIIG